MKADRRGGTTALSELRPDSGYPVNLLDRARLAAPRGESGRFLCGCRVPVVRH